MTAFVHTQYLGKDSYFNRLVSFIETNGVAAVGEAMREHQMPGGSQVPDDLDKIRDGSLGIDSNLPCRLDEYFQDGLLDRVLSADGDYLYFLKSVDGGLSHLSPDQQALVEQRRSAEAKLYSRIPVVTDALYEAKDLLWDQVRKPVEYEYSRFLLGLAYHIDSLDAEQIHSKVIDVLCKAPEIMVDPIERMRAQWVVGHLHAQFPELQATLADAWEKAWPGVPMPIPAVETQLPTIQAELQQAGWTLVSSDERQWRFEKPLWSLDGATRSNAAIDLKQIGQAIQLDSTAFWGMSNQLNADVLTIGTASALDAPFGFRATLKSVQARMESHPWTVAPGTIKVSVEGEQPAPRVDAVVNRPR